MREVVREDNAHFVSWIGFDTWEEAPAVWRRLKVADAFVLRKGLRGRRKLRHVRARKIASPIVLGVRRKIEKSQWRIRIERVWRIPESSRETESEGSAL